MNKNSSLVVVLLAVILVVAFLLPLYLWPLYRVWQKEQWGKAELAEAQLIRRIKIEEAESNLEAEKLNALAEIERAKGAAEAIRIEGGSLTERYIQYLWVRQNTFNDKTTIYIPTEANLPILETGRLGDE